ncbi:hypothetical protein RT21_15470 [Pseudomonas sp. 10B238]|uniref:hypothetical protein n=1 Tax=Pseudomonas sp. 10B238 TaxID=1586417 RepID=UPI000617F760|nr:hypothetical protein [Pseudomonas sp. 10B238]KJJ62159.1 hypothetical protein RT21_15470 [Pseudomonas sp. 10B238]
MKSSPLLGGRRLSRTRRAAGKPEPWQSRQLATGNWQLATGNWQPASVGSAQWISGQRLKASGGMFP